MQTDEDKMNITGNVTTFSPPNRRTKEVVFPKDRPAPYEVPVNIGNYSPPVENNYMTPK